MFVVAFENDDTKMRVWVVNRMSGGPSEQSREHHNASDFGTFSA
jgi:hypothetical protein